MLIDLIKSSNNIVAFTGAGISTESGIPDFRSTSNGLYTTGKFSGHSPEEILSKRFFFKNTEIFFNFCKEKLNDKIICGINNKKPNRSHYALSKLEELGKLKCIITQNIDNLHQNAGNKKVLELHGNGNRFYCISCATFYPYELFLKLLNNKIIPRCSCGGIIRPDIILFDEALDDIIYNNAINFIKECDLLISIGSSLLVQPAADLLQYRNKEKCKLVILNNTMTPFDKAADLVINENCGDILENVMKEL